MDDFDTRSIDGSRCFDKANAFTTVDDHPHYRHFAGREREQHHLQMKRLPAKYEIWERTWRKQMIAP
jgi:hypothetical protein